MDGERDVINYPIRLLQAVTKKQKAEKVTPKSGAHFMQFQYAQMAVPNYSVCTLLHPSEEGTPARLVKLDGPTSP